MDFQKQKKSFIPKKKFRNLYKISKINAQFKKSRIQGKMNLKNLNL